MELSEILKKEKWMFYLEGTLLMLLGVLAIILPQLTTVSLAIMAGIFLMIAGAVMFFRAFRFKTGRLFWISLVSGIITVAVGALMLGNLQASLFLLTFFLIVFLSFEGALKIILANALRPLKNWGYMMFSGITTLLLAFVIIAGLPGTALWSLGLLFGIYLLVAGFSMVAFAIGLEKPREERAH